MEAASRELKDSMEAVIITDIQARPCISGTISNRVGYSVKVILSIDVKKSYLANTEIRQQNLRRLRS